MTKWADLMDRFWSMVDSDPERVYTRYDLHELFDQLEEEYE
jgi:hypothetical protein